MCCLLSHTFPISSDNWCEGLSSKSEAFTLCDRMPFTTLVVKKDTCCAKQLLFERLCKCLTNYDPRKQEVLNSTRAQNEVFTFWGKNNNNLFFLFESTMPAAQCLLTHIDCSEAEAHKCHPLSSFITAVSNSRSALLTVSHSRCG